MTKENSGDYDAKREKREATRAPAHSIFMEKFMTRPVILYEMQV